MMRRLALPLLCLGLSLPFATSSRAWDSSQEPDGIPSQEIAREAKFLLGQFRTQMHMQSEAQDLAEDSGSEVSSPTQKPTNASQILRNLGSEDLLRHGSSKTEALSDGYGSDGGYGGGGGTPPADGGDGFRRFLRSGLEQSQGRSHQEGWKSLRRFVRRALEIGGSSVPRGVLVSLRAADLGSEGGKYWSERFESLGMAVRFVLDNARDFEDPSKEVYVVSKVAQISVNPVDKGESSYKFLRSFLAETLRAYERDQPRVRGATLRAIYAGMDKGKYWTDRTHWTLKSLQRFQRGVANLGHSFEVNVAGSQGIDHGEGNYKSQVSFLKTFSGDKSYFPNAFTHHFLLANLDAASTYQYWSGRSEALQKASSVLTRAIQSPGQYFQAALQVAQVLDGKDRWELNSRIAQAALRGRFLQSFDAELLNTSLQTASRKNYYSERNEDLESAFRQFR